MLTPTELVGIADDVIEIYSQVEQDIVSDIARRILKTGYITETAQWQIEKAQEFGYFQGDVEEILAKATGKTKKEISKLMKEAGTLALERDDEIYREAGLNPIALAKSPALKAVLLQGIDDTIALLGNFTHTTAQMATLAYNNLLDRCYLQIISGAYDPNTAIKMAIKDIATQGINKIAYPSGVEQSVESSVRRAVTTGINQSVSKLQIARMDEMECDLVEVSSHGGARPEHAVWQGQIYSRSGKSKKYPDFVSSTGYGTGAGLCGWNCYHTFYPYFEGLSTRTFSKDPAADAGKDNDEMYEQQQKQRTYERRVRESKKECVTFNAAMEACTDPELKEELRQEFVRASVKLKNREANLEHFLNKTRRTREREREQVQGFNRSVSSKAVWANKKKGTARS